jgi:hypothetical protein
MSNIILGYPNRASSANFSGGSWRASLPISNVKDRRTLKLARSTNALEASTQFDIDLTQARNISLFALRRHNLSEDSTVRILASSDSSFSSTVYDSGFNEVYPAVFDTLELQWEDSNFWMGKPKSEDIERFVTLYLLVLPVITQARYWRVEIKDTSNPDGYVDIGSVFVSDKFEPDVNVIYGASIQNTNRTTVSESQSGVEFFDQREQKRVARFTLDNMSYSEGYQKAFDSTQILGVDGEVLFSMDTDDKANLMRNSLVGRYVSTNPLTFVRFNQTSMPFEIQEIL